VESEGRTESPEWGALEFVCFIPDDEWGTYTRRHHLGALRRFGRVLAVERPLGLQRAVAARRFRRPELREIAGPDGTIHLLRPRLLVPRGPGRGLPLVRRVRLRSLGDQVARALCELDMARPVAFLTSPSQDWFFDLGLEARAVCFELSDEFSLYTQYPFVRSARHHREVVEMVRRCDVVFATARSLAEDFQTSRGSVHWVPNTADPSDFAIPEDVEVYPEVAGLPRPVIGFIGGLNPWIDIDLLLELQERRPEWTIVFSADVRGPRAFLGSDKMHEFRRCNRSVRFLGWVPYGRLPSFLAGVDVCALFHRREEVSRYIHPNKIYQYLASGKPIVSTDFLPELGMFGRHIRVARNAAEFVDAVEDSLGERDPDRVRDRIEYARRNAPVHRAARKVELIRRHLSGGAPSRGKIGRDAAGFARKSISSK